MIRPRKAGIHRLQARHFQIIRDDKAIDHRDKALARHVRRISQTAGGQNLAGGLHQRAEFRQRTLVQRLGPAVLAFHLEETLGAFIQQILVKIAADQNIVAAFVALADIFGQQRQLGRHRLRLPL